MPDPMPMPMMTMEMYFYSGYQVKFLIEKWTTMNSGQYWACLIVTFLTAAFIEFLASRKIRNDFLNMLVYATRLFLSYMVMLILMTFNAGLFFAVITGYTLGYFLTGFSPVTFETRKESIQSNSQNIMF